ncbi:hypothetical protein [Jannaschia sp. R86511]|uniref:hypothetical protein n=1 Tax=Jannaschia sp. R86511 TaxID=3093853 RepID=UPI0036D331C3
MAPPTTGAWRALRAGLVVAVVTGLSTAGHLAGGGHVASARAAVLALLLVSVAAAALTAVRLTPVRLLAALAAGQVVVHHALAWTPGGHCAAPASSPLFESTVVAGCGPAGPHEAMWSDPAMLLGHLVATVLAAAVLGHGEQLLWTARDLLALRLLVLPDAVPAQAAPALAFPPVPAPVPSTPVERCDPVRGPPATPSASPVPV